MMGRAGWGKAGERRGSGAAALALAACALVLAACSSSGPATTPVATPSQNAASSAASSASGLSGPSGCTLPGATTFVTNHELYVTKGANGYEGAVLSSVSQVLGQYVSQAWPDGFSGASGAQQVVQWFSNLVGPQGSSLLQQVAKGPEAISSWTGGAPNPSQAASVAFDERFLGWEGFAPNGAPQWGTVTLVSDTSGGSYASEPGGIGLDSSGVPVGACEPWAVELGVENGSTVDWWYIGGMAQFAVSGGTTATLVDPLVSGEVYEQAGTASSRPDWVPPPCSPGSSCNPFQPVSPPSGAVPTSLPLSS
jgi:hypothetical protein